MRPDSYREQACCGVCKFVFEYWDYDNVGPYFFCHVDGSDRPLCGSSALDEDYRCEGAGAKWWKWANPREVVSGGVCDRFERRRREV